ncbi:MAG: NRDE family protein [Woeseia sp.]
MCLIVFAWQSHPDYRLILAGNRDELHRRPAQAMGWWPDAQNVLGGRDLQAGGTWLAINRNGRLAAVTNYRENPGSRKQPHSRGELVSDFVRGKKPPGSWCNDIPADDYAGFCLLAADNDSLCYTSNRTNGTTLLDAGIYGLSNASLDTPWPKLVRCRDRLAALIDENRVNPGVLFELLADTTPAPAGQVDNEHLPFDVARAVSAPFIRTRDYGTRCTSVLLVSHDGRALVTERRYDRDGHPAGESEFRFAIG